MSKVQVTSSSRFLLKHKQCGQTSKEELIMCGTIEGIQAQASDWILYLFLSIGMPYYQEGCHIEYLT